MRFWNHYPNFWLILKKEKKKPSSSSSTYIIFSPRNGLCSFSRKKIAYLLTYVRTTMYFRGEYFFPIFQLLRPENGKKKGLLETVLPLFHKYVCYLHPDSPLTSFFRLLFPPLHIRVNSAWIWIHLFKKNQQEMSQF